METLINNSDYSVSLRNFNYSLALQKFIIAKYDEDSVLDVLQEILETTF